MSAPSRAAESLPLERLLSAEDVGQILGVSAKTVRRLPIPSVSVSTGRHPMRRYRRADVERWIEERAT